MLNLKSRLLEKHIIGGIMRTREMEMLNDTLKIFEEGFYIKGGEKKGIKLSKKELHASNYTEEEKM